jgi:DMSO/TMAO reductase YedYZ molybdopterin-dependent catalytic subunit
MNTRHILFFALAVTLAAQELQIAGAVKQPLTLTAGDLAKMPRATVQTRNEGMTVTYEGVWLHDVLKRAGAPSGTELRGKALASYVLAEAKDGYQVLFSLAEFDPVFTDTEVLLADQADGRPLTAAQGPFRLVLPKDKRGARSVRMLTKLEVVVLRK